EHTAAHRWRASSAFAAAATCPSMQRRQPSVPGGLLARHEATAACARGAVVASHAASLWRARLKEAAPRSCCAWVQILAAIADAAPGPGPPAGAASATSARSVGPRIICADDYTVGPTLQAIVPRVLRIGVAREI